MRKNVRKIYSKLAKEWAGEVESEYHDSIISSIENSKIYDSHYNLIKISGIKTEFAFEELDTVNAIFRERAISIMNGIVDTKICALNFASFKNPGGMFLEGSTAQEECLCHKSTLYNILSRFRESFYIPNKKRLNRGLYDNNLIYSPNVLFIQEGKTERDVSRSTFSDVITCAAPNKKAAQKFQGATDEEVRRALISRIDHVLGCTSNELVDVLILGAFGCGVFGNSIFDVAGIFEILLHEKFESVFKKIVYAVPKLHEGDLSSIRFKMVSERMRKLLNGEPGTSFTEEEKRLYNEVKEFISMN